MGSWGYNSTCKGYFTPFITGWGPLSEGLKDFLRNRKTRNLEPFWRGDVLGAPKPFTYSWWFQKSGCFRTKGNAWKLLPPFKNPGFFWVMINPYLRTWWNLKTNYIWWKNCWKRRHFSVSLRSGSRPEKCRRANAQCPAHGYFWIQMDWHERIHRPRHMAGCLCR